MSFLLGFLDPRLRGNLPRYVLQCLLAASALLIVLSLGDALARAVVIAAIGSTAFVLFIMPNSETATPRHVVGGHLIALVVGAVASVFDAEGGFSFALQGSIAVGVAIFAMAATDTEHAPAAGTALGVVAHELSWDLVVLLVASVVVLVVIHQLLRPWLRDLY